MSSFLNLVVRERPLDAPFHPKEKCWLAAALAATAATIGTAASYASNSKTNAANQEMNAENIKLQRETNQQQVDMMREQNAFSVDMWNKENAYNNPAAQVGRMLAAGVNPAMQFGKVSEASQLLGVNPPSLTAPQASHEMRPTDFSGITESGINAVNAYNASRMMQAETKNKDALTANTVFDTTYKQKSMQDNLRYLRNIASGSGWQADMVKKQLEFYEATVDYDIQMKYGDTLMQKKSYEALLKQLDYQQLQNDILEITKGYAHQMSEAQIAQLWSSVHQANAQIGLINANRLLTNEERLNKIEQRVGIILDNGMKGIDYHVKDSVQDALIDMAYSNADEQAYRAGFEGRKYFGGQYVGTQLPLMQPNKLLTHRLYPKGNAKRYKANQKVKFVPK